jgi:hemoglobin-like flavoprotein
MQAQTVQLVQQSWNKVRPIAAQAAQLFYRNLFVRDPALRQMFRGDMEQQGQRLMQMIGMAVGRLDDLDMLLPVLRSLGERHNGYGVQRAHYDTVGAALLETLEQGLGEAFTPQVRQAWTEVYGVIVSVMTEPAAEAVNDSFAETLAEAA